MNLYEKNINSAGFGPDENSPFDDETKWAAEELKSLEQRNHEHGCMIKNAAAQNLPIVPNCTYWRFGCEDYRNGTKQCTDCQWYTSKDLTPYWTKKGE